MIDQAMINLLAERKAARKPAIVPHPELDFQLEIELKCKELTDGQVAFLEHVAYNAAHASVRKAIDFYSKGADVPQREYPRCPSCNPRSA
jgi:hypothetical protein